MLQMSLYNRIRSSVQRKFPDGGIDRVVDCWDRFVEGQKVEKFLDPPNNVILQKADCYVEGLSATCFHDLAIHPWAENLESKHMEILTELQSYHKRHSADIPTINALTGNFVGDWLPPRDSAGNSYGPEWKTLGLQDRSVWDEDRVKEFPHTVQILQDLDVPSCEVFFAKQGPKSGIKPHSDKNNFIITCHLALDVPEGECWIQVGDQKHFWKNGKSVVFDTSIMHSTENTSDKVRYVLLIRFWHPELTGDERGAFKFIFDLLDHAAAGDEALDQFEFNAFLGKDNHKGLNTVVGGGNKPQSQSQSQSMSRNKSSKKSVLLDESDGKKSATKLPSKGFGSKK